MGLNLQGKTALVTGSTKGIGFAIASRLAASGVHVTINGRSQEQVDKAITRLKEQTGKEHFSGVAADLQNLAGVEALIAQVPEIDILVNNVGSFEQVDFFEISDEQWTSILELNLMSGVRLSRFYLKKMLKRNEFGRILFISSECGQVIPPDMIHYGVSKTSQIALARGLAELTKGSQVTVNSILPGPTLSDGVESFVAEMAEQQKITLEEVAENFFRSYRPNSLLQRFIDPKEVGDTVAFFASPLAAATNGAAIRVDGGTVRSI